MKTNEQGETRNLKRQRTRDGETVDLSYCVRSDPQAIAIPDPATWHYGGDFAW